MEHIVGLPSRKTVPVYPHPSDCGGGQPRCTLQQGGTGFPLCLLVCETEMILRFYLEFNAYGGKQLKILFG